jgi:hypothetical protein
LIELKHAWQWLPSEMLDQEGENGWSSVLKQIKSFSRPAARGVAIDGSGPILKMAMLVLPAWMTSSDKAAAVSKNGTSNEIAYKLHERVLGSFDSEAKPNWSCVWALPDELQDFAFGEDELYPCVSILVKVEAI